MKAFLKSIDGIFPLQPKVTTVGRDGCNLVIQSPSVGSQHALIEYCDVRDWFVLQDLDTVLGTTVNGFLFQNTGVQLKPGDVVRFGSHPVLYEFSVDTNAKALSPTQGQFSIRTHPHVSPSDSNLPQIFRSNNNNNTAIVNWPTVNNRHGSVALPRPPISLRPRPLSSLARRPSTEKLPQAVALGAHGQTTTELSCTSSSGCSSISQHSQPEDMHVQMRYLSDEVKRMSGFESACKQKDETIVQLKNEVGNLQRILRQKDIGQDVEPEMRLRLMQMDVNAKESQRRVKSAGSKHNSVGSDGRNGFEESDDVVVGSEVEQMKKEKNLTIGLIAQMQRDMTSKDTMISRLAKEIEDLKKENLTKETNITALKTTIDGSESEKTAVENHLDKEQEIALLQHKLKSSESQKQTLNETISVLKKEVYQLKGSVDSSQATINKYKLDLNAAKGRSEDLERAERLVRVALEQISKRLEKLRSRVIQTAYCAPGSKIPEKQISDDELLLALKTCLEDRTELAKKLKTYEDRQGPNRKLAATADNAKKLKQQMSETAAPGVKKT